MDIKEVILELIADNTAMNLHSKGYKIDEYITGYAKGYHNALVDLLDKIGVEHNVERYD